MNNRTDRVDFDEYADQYEDLLKDQLSFFSNDRGYFSDHKASIASKQFAKLPKTVLDFGCGIGLSLPFLEAYFPGADLFATDISEKSLEHVASANPDVHIVMDNDLDGKAFDLIFVAGVFHHVSPADRPALTKRLSALLSTRGKLCIFDHNPYNPVTQRMVSTCPFDEDAVLLSRNELTNLLKINTNLEIERRRYCLFFPEPLKALQPLERWIGFVPLGGQYYVVARR